MNEKVVVSKKLLAKQESDIDYLIEVFNALREVSADDQEAFFNESSNDQISLMIYTYLYDQVQNGGFIQLIFNGYAPYIFNSPLSSSLSKWGAIETATLLDEMTNDAHQVVAYLEDKEFTADVLSDTYPKFPQFEDYDKRFYENTGIPEIKKFVETHLEEIVILSE